MDRLLRRSAAVLAVTLGLTPTTGPLRAHAAPAKPAAAAVAAARDSSAGEAPKPPVHARSFALPPAEPDSDGTRTRHFTLANGLRVVTRSVPGARTAAVTLCYRLGTLEDPAGREGIAELAAQVAITARAGDVPQRTMAELDQLRPAGWSIKVGSHVSELTEAAPTEQLPGVLHQMCRRLGGLVVSDTLVRQATTDVRKRLLENYDARPERALISLSNQLTGGRTSEQAARYANGQGIAHVPASELRQLLGARLAPANTVLCIVGDLSGVDVQRLIESEASKIPGGTAEPPIAWGRLHDAEARVNRSDLKAPLGVVAIIAPALTDSLHPYFIAFTMSAGGQLNGLWGRPEAPLTNRFQLSIASDPELVRFYPPLTVQVDPLQVLLEGLSTDERAILDPTNVAQASQSSLWLVGGPLPTDLRKRVAGDPTVIHTLATTLAALEQYGDAAFWQAYRLRLLRAATLDLGPLYRYYGDPRHHVTLVMMPGS